MDAQGRLGHTDEEFSTNQTMDMAAPNLIENEVPGPSDPVTISVADGSGETVDQDLTIDQSTHIFSQSGGYFADAGAWQTAFEALTDPTIMVEIDGNRTINVSLGPRLTVGAPLRHGLALLIRLIQP